MLLCISKSGPSAIVPRTFTSTQQAQNRIPLNQYAKRPERNLSREHFYGKETRLKWGSKKFRLLLFFFGVIPMRGAIYLQSQATLNSFLREIKSWEIWISLMQHIFHMWTTTHVHHLTPATWFIQGSLCCKSKSNQARMRHVNYESLIAFNVWENLGFLRSILCNAVFN